MTIKKLILGTKLQLIILVLLAIGLNINTLSNEYAVDDVVVMTGNKLVEKGIKGIPEIASHDYFYGFEGTDNNGLSGGRYRPVALIVFALEHQFFGANPMVSHLINILFFALLVALLYTVLQTYIFRGQVENLAFLTCLLFVVHPIHTEVIANVKSRDELITFILLLVSLITLIKHTEKRSIGILLVSLFCFFLALLTRESAVAFIVVVPLVLYFFFDRSIKRSFQFSIPLILVFISYIALRFLIIGFKSSTETDVLNAPFLFATASEAFATKVFILFKYLCLLFFPYPLSCDYGYNQIPYIDIYCIQFILSSLLFLALIAYAVYTFRKRSLFSFSILYFMATIILVANFLVDIGAPLAERLLFQPSLAFCIVVASFYIKIEKRFKLFATSAFLIVLLLFSIKTILRNAEWKDNETLYLADVISAPNSVKTNLVAADKFIIKSMRTETTKELKAEYLQKAIDCDERAIKIYPNNPTPYLDLGVAYYGLHDYFKAADLWIKAYNMNPSDPRAKKSTEQLSAILFQEGNKFYQKGNLNDAIKQYRKSVDLNSKNVEAWYNLGGNYFLIDDTKNAIEAWQNVLKLSPDHQLNKEQFHLH